MTQTRKQVNWREVNKRAARTAKKRHGNDCHHRWGTLGGNPVLIEQGIRNRKLKAEAAVKNNKAVNV